MIETKQSRTNTKKSNSLMRSQSPFVGGIASAGRALSKASILDSVNRSAGKKYKLKSNRKFIIGCRQMVNSLFIENQWEIHYWFKKSEYRLTQSYCALFDSMSFPHFILPCNLLTLFYLSSNIGSSTWTKWHNFTNIHCKKIFGSTYHMHLRPPFSIKWYFAIFCEWIVLLYLYKSHTKKKRWINKQIITANLTQSEFDTQNAAYGLGTVPSNRHFNCQMLLLL